MNKKILIQLSFILLSTQAASLNAEALVQPSLLAATENGVFVSDGRYFVAGEAGIHEVKTAPDDRAACDQDAVSGYTYCEVVPREFEGQNCFFSGMTTDGSTLYSVCTVWGDDAGQLQVLNEPERALMFRVQPQGDGTFDVTTTEFQDPVWYNGMAMLDDDTILMTPSNLLGGDSAIVRLDIRSHEPLNFGIEEWLEGSVGYLLPNGLAVDKGYVYFVGGQNLFRVHVRRNGKPGTPVLLFQTTLNKMLDDLVVDGDWIAVTNHGLANGLGVNAITRVHKTGLAIPRTTWTGRIQPSSLTIDPGTFFEPGSYIATSFFQGGIHRFYP